VQFSKDAITLSLAVTLAGAAACSTSPSAPPVLASPKVENAFKPGMPGPPGLSRAALPEHPTRAEVARAETVSICTLAARDVPHGRLVRTKGTLSTFPEGAWLVAPPDCLLGIAFDDALIEHLTPGGMGRIRSGFDNGGEIVLVGEARNGHSPDVVQYEPFTIVAVEAVTEVR
jgi:hypothetical protein